MRTGDLAHWLQRLPGKHKVEFDLQYQTNKQNTGNEGNGFCWQYPGLGLNHSTQLSSADGIQF